VETIIDARPVSLLGYIKSVWRYRLLILVFAKRDLKVKYAQTWLGFSWGIIQPLVSLLIFTFFFGYVLQWKAEGLPYSLYVLSGLLIWSFFTYVVYQGCSSMQESANLIKKIYFPKAILPLSKVVVGLVELGVGFMLIVPLLLLTQQPLSLRIVLLPFVVLFATLAGLSIVFLVASFAYRKRDLYIAVPFLMNFSMWITPVFFTPNTLPEPLRFIWFINPMAAVVEACRWCLFQNWSFSIAYLPSLLMLFPISVVAIWYYAKKEELFSDYI
jgi:lipopolysaccharide transport system permease protein